jgi:hypothetical protein
MADLFTGDLFSGDHCEEWDLEEDKAVGAPGCAGGGSGASAESGAGECTAATSSGAACPASQPRATAAPHREGGRPV